MQKIDLVYMWVDGNDPKWKREKEKYLATERCKTNLPPDATVDARWRDNDELKYALRSAEKYVPWINHIYIITGFNQVPKWLNTAHPKITIIPHQDIMPNYAMPTFCSDNIEMCIANILNLAEHFLLSNDDMFFARPLAPSFFFDSKNRAIFRYHKSHKFIRRIGFALENQTDYRQRLTIAQQQIYKTFNKKLFTYLPSHGIDPYIKSTIINCRNHPLIKRDIDLQLFDKFRHGNQIQRIIFNLYDKIHGTAKFIRTRNYKQTKSKLWNKIYNALHWRCIKNSPCYCTDAYNANLYKRTPPIVCINDTATTTDEMRENNRKWLEWKFPEKSSFEK